jgi:membrane protease YdiL (CAAX protease family)
MGTEKQNIVFLLLFILLFILFRTLGFLSSGFDWTVVQILICIVTVLGVTLAWRVLEQRTIAESIREIGFGMPHWRVVGLASVISLLMLAFFPIYSRLTGINLPLQNNWPWILVGILTGTGIAEEILFRGYAFNFFRQTHSFWRAATLSMLLFGMMHLILLLWLPIPIAIAAILLSVLAAYPTAYLFENGNRTIWPSAILHTTALATNLFVIPTDLTVTVSLLWIAVLLAGMLLVLVAGRILLGISTIRKVPTSSNAT